jgi:hypothetical protein
VFFVKFFNEYQMVSVSFIVLAISAILMFFGRKFVVEMMVDYERICADRLFSVVINDCKQNFEDTKILRLLSKDCRFGGRLVQEISSVVMPLGISIVAFPIMLYINFFATIFLIFVAVFAIIPYFFIASKAKKLSILFENAASTDGQFKKQAIARFKKDKKFIEPISFPHEDFKSLYKQRLIVPHYGILIGGLQFAFCLGILGL